MPGLGALIGFVLAGCGGRGAGCWRIEVHSSSLTIQRLIPASPLAATVLRHEEPGQLTACHSY